MIQTPEMSYKDKVKMYKKVKKDKLIEMLIEANKHLSKSPTIAKSEEVSFTGGLVAYMNGISEEEINERVERYKKLYPDSLHSLSKIRAMVINGIVSSKYP